MSKRETLTINTSFVVSDLKDLDSFLNVAFRSLERAAKKMIVSTGTYSIVVKCNQETGFKTSKNSIKEITSG